jgi:hypothetical protein
MSVSRDVRFTHRVDERVNVHLNVRASTVPTFRYLHDT